MNRTFHHLPKLGLAVCIGVIACLSLFAQRHSPGTVSAAQNAPIANDSPVITPTFQIFMSLVALNYPALLCEPPPPDMSAWWQLDETSGTSAFDIAGFPTSGTHSHYHSTLIDPCLCL